MNSRGVDGGKQPPTELGGGDPPLDLETRRYLDAGLAAVTGSRRGINDVDRRSIENGQIGEGDLATGDQPMERRRKPITPTAVPSR